jgi:4-amino-4-deoxy-L-arabinose transferase-like glycosyltransferase
MTPARDDRGRARPGRDTLAYVAIVVVAALTYLYGLSGRYIPKNGDENVYAHIVRLTGASGHLLPLRSELDGMRNTKPPMLTWQGIASTRWGQDWTAWRLRWPSVVYTFATAVMVGLLAARLARRTQAGWIAAACWLAFFSTYRYGRPFLTSAPEVFWLFAPFFGLAYGGSRVFESRWAYPALCGVAIGVGLLYKSFALLLPVGLGLAWWRLHRRGYRMGEFFVRDVPGLALCAVLSLAIFSLWFALDPDPAAVWREFVLGENAEKFDAEGGYLRTLLWGASSVWSLALNYPLNAGLLGFAVISLVAVSLRQRRALSAEERLLWLWVIALFVVFCLPSQRSGRYLFPAMPAIAVLLAVRWQVLGRWAFVLALLASLPVALLLAYLAWRLDVGMPAEALYGCAYWAVFGVLALVVTLGLVRPDWTRWASLAAVFIVYVAFAATVAPLEGAVGRFEPQAQQAVAGRDVWVPCNFRASQEPYRFALVGANVLGYEDNGEHTPEMLAERFTRFVAQVPLTGGGCDGCRVIGERLEIRGRHTPQDIDDMLHGHVFEHLFVRELLIEGPLAATAPERPTPGTASQCR